MLPRAAAWTRRHPSQQRSLLHLRTVGTRSTRGTGQLAVVDAPHAMKAAKAGLCAPQVQILGCAVVQLCTIWEGALARGRTRRTGAPERRRTDGDLPERYPNDPNDPRWAMDEVTRAVSWDGGAVCFAPHELLFPWCGFSVEERTGRRREPASGATKPKARQAGIKKGSEKDQKTARGCMWLDSDRWMH